MENKYTTAYRIIGEGIRGDALSALESVTMFLCGTIPCDELSRELIRLGKSIEHWDEVRDEINENERKGR